MSQSLSRSAVRGATLGQCCHSIVLIEDVMGRLALLQGYFSLLSGSAPETPANGTARILAGHLDRPASGARHAVRHGA